MGTGLRPTCRGRSAYFQLLVCGLVNQLFLPCLRRQWQFVEFCAGFAPGRVVLREYRQEAIAVRRLDEVYHLVLPRPNSMLLSDRSHSRSDTGHRRCKYFGGASVAATSSGRSKPDGGQSHVGMLFAVKAETGKHGLCLAGFQSSMNAVSQPLSEIGEVVAQHDKKAARFNRCLECEVRPTEKRCHALAGLRQRRCRPSSSKSHERLPGRAPSPAQCPWW